MNDVDRSEDVNGAPPNGSGVLANLPRARPQRSSARRLAARGRNGSSTAMREPRPPASTPSAATSKTAGEKRKRAKANASGAALAESSAAKGASATGKVSTPRSAPAKRPTARKRARPAPAQEPAPRQGFECESDTPSGSLRPPGGVELVASAAELVGELAKAGLSRSERLLKDVVSRLPLP